MSKVTGKLQSVAGRMSPVSLAKLQKTRSVVSTLADDLGMVYFGAVSQRQDDHKLLRGITVSTSHIDSHYSVGTFRGYDVAMVVRSDEPEHPKHGRRKQHWTIITFDLHTSFEVPPMVITPASNDELLFGKFSQLVELPLTHSESALKFLQKFKLRGSMAKVLEIERLLSDIMFHGMITHFGDVSIEVSENTVYIYSRYKHPTRRQLESQISNGLWFAQHLDHSAEIARHELGV